MLLKGQPREIEREQEPHGQVDVPLTTKETHLQLLT